MVPFSRRGELVHPVVLGYRLGLMVVPRLPRPLAVSLTLRLADCIAQLDTPPNRRHRQNLARVVGRPPSSPTVRRLARRAVRVQALNYLDLLASPRLSAAEILARVTIRGREHLDAALAQGRGTIVVSGHVGSVDWAGLAVTALGYRGAGIVEPLHPPALYELIAGLRRRFGAELIPLGPTVLKEAGAVLRRNQPLGIALDLDLTGEGLPVPLFGHWLRMPQGPAVLALRYQAPFVPLTCLRQGSDRFVLTFDPPFSATSTGPLARRIQETTILLSFVLGRQLRAHPDQWVMFHDVWLSPGEPALSAAVGTQPAPRSEAPS
jgi:lauroyl/myristoyl acyltransferase